MVGLLRDFVDRLRRAMGWFCVNGLEESLGLRIASAQGRGGGGGGGGSRSPEFEDSCIREITWLRASLALHCPIRLPRSLANPGRFWRTCWANAMK